MSAVFHAMTVLNIEEERLIRKEFVQWRVTARELGTNRGPRYDTTPVRWNDCVTA